MKHTQVLPQPLYVTPSCKSAIVSEKIQQSITDDQQHSQNIGLKLVSFTGEKLNKVSRPE